MTTANPNNMTNSELDRLVLTDCPHCSPGPEWTEKTTDTLRRLNRCLCPIETQEEWDRLHGSQYDAEEKAQFEYFADPDNQCECQNNGDYCAFCQERLAAEEKTATLKRGEEMQLEAIGNILSF